MWEQGQPPLREGCGFLWAALLGLHDRRHANPTERTQVTETFNKATSIVTLTPKKPYFVKGTHHTVSALCSSNKDGF